MNSRYNVRELTEAEFKPLFDKNVQSVFDDTHSYTLKDVLSEAEQQSLKRLEQNLGNPYQLYLAAFDKDNNIVGWTWGKQEDKATFLMVNSGVLQQHRRQGIYQALLKQCIETASQQGFQLIYSRHVATNNSVIIPKLKAGFIISKLEIEDRYGILVHLHFYTNPTRRKVMDYRTGQVKPDKQVKDLFKL